MVWCSVILKALVRFGTVLEAILETPLRLWSVRPRIRSTNLASPRTVKTLIFSWTITEHGVYLRHNVSPAQIGMLGEGGTV